jgi:hypothetical protein
MTLFCCAKENTGAATRKTYPQIKRIIISSN